MLKIKDIFKSRKYKILDKIEKCFIERMDLELDIFDKQNGYAIEMFLNKVKKYNKQFDNGKYMSLISNYDKRQLSIPLEVKLHGYSMRCNEGDFEDRYLIFRFSKLTDNIYNKIKADLVEEVSNE